MTKLVPKEIFLLEKFASPEYLAELRDVWQEMLSLIEQCLDQFMLSLPADYRNRPLPEQPDVVWGERVLPIFRQTYQDLCAGYIRLTHGDFSGLSSANGPINDFQGQREYSAEWMSRTDVDRYFELLNLAYTMAGNICATDESSWEPGELADGRNCGPLDIPAALPVYKLDRRTKISTGDSVEVAGVYTPDTDGASAQFLHPDNEAPPAILVVGMRDLINTESGKKYGEEADFADIDCEWTLVERDAKTDKTIRPQSLLPTDMHRLPAGNICPVSGYFFTPAKEGSRRYFQQGEIMPDIESTYGATIWQWDINQG